MSRRDRQRRIKDASPRRRARVSPRLSLFAAAVLGGLVLLAAWGYPGYQRIREIESQISVLEQRKQQLEAERLRLQKEVKWLETDAAVEKIAREELGLVKPGERPLVEVEGGF